MTIRDTIKQAVTWVKRNPVEAVARIGAGCLVAATTASILWVPAYFSLAALSASYTYLLYWAPHELIAGNKKAKSEQRSLTANEYFSSLLKHVVIAANIIALSFWAPPLAATICVMSLGAISYSAIHGIAQGIQYLADKCCCKPVKKSALSKENAMPSSQATVFRSVMTEPGQRANPLVANAAESRVHKNPIARQRKQAEPIARVAKNANLHSRSLSQ